MRKIKEGHIKTIRIVSKIFLQTQSGTPAEKRFCKRIVKDFINQISTNRKNLNREIKELKTQNEVQPHSNAGRGAWK